MLVSPPPVVPRSRKAQPDELDEWLTLVVHTGTAHVRVDGTEHRVPAGQGLRLPPGTDHDVRTDPGTVTLPIFSDREPADDDVERISRVFVDRQARAAAIDHYGRGLQEGLLELPGQSVQTLPEFSDASVPAMPTWGPAARVAAELRRHPEVDRTLEDWAAWASCSPSTLRRGFHTQTQMTFARWRQLTRLAQARDYLAAGGRVGDAAVQVGFESRWGFSSAFRQHYGMTPRDWAADASAALGTQGPASFEDGISVPQRELAETTLPDNVMLWVRAGELRARFAGRTWTGRAGDVVWLPAGASVTSIPESALPLSVLCTECVQLECPQRARFSRAWHDWLVWAAVSTNGLIRAEQHHGRDYRLYRHFHTHVIDAFEAQVAVERARRVPMPDEAAARAAASAFLRSMGTSSELGSGDVTEGVREAFLRDTGMTFTAWRHAARMRAARTLLQDGIPAGGVATRAGYTMLSNFSRAFTRFHGIGPREFQSLEGPEDDLVVE